MRSFSFLFLLIFLPVVRVLAAAPPSLTPTVAGTSAVSPADAAFFENKIRPVLVDNCYKCHSHDADRIKGGLLLDSPQALLMGGDTGPALIPGQPGESLLITAITYKDDDLQMPPKGKKLSDAQIANLTEWVRRGAPDPRAGASPSHGGVGKNHWAFQPVKKTAVPAAATPTDAAWIKTPVDNFVLAKLEDHGMAPNAPADRRTLIRRVNFDLIGLPPSESEIAAFIADTAPDAYAKLVDRLLASPAYGERWGRYWLDVTRYSDTKGDAKGREDLRYGNAWTYRDYVIDAFNRDEPYNQFIVEQLAADRLLAESYKKAKAKNSAAEIPQDQRSLAALGFLSLGNKFDGNAHDIINDRIDVTSKAFLGLTVSCARCHDHKFDPIPTKDYYSLYGVFANVTEPKFAREQPTLFAKIPKTPDLLDYLTKSDDLKKQADAVEADYKEFRKSRTKDSEKRKELVRAETKVQREIGDLDSSHPGAPARANVVTDVPRSRDYNVLVRGEAQNKGPVVPRRFLEILSPDPKNRPEWHEGSGRLQLALAIADPKNPMTARVMVNRVWQQHFGAGFVATPDDLGNMSSPPTHPELLDYLATRFVEGGWSVKNLHRLIVLSATYRQSSANNAKYAEQDPHNQYLWRANLRRLDFEQLHDSLLAIAGTLEPKLGGRSIPMGTEEFATRRAVYTYIDRRNPPELLTQFDFPNPDVPSGRRYETIVPAQALFLMNSPLVVETARKLTHRPEFADLKSDQERVASLYLAIYQRPPTEQEVSLGVRYVKANPTGLALDVPVANAVAGVQDTKRKQRIAERVAAMSKNKNGVDNRPPGGFAMNESRAPVDAWTKLAHALFQSNEAMFLN
ncbi:MAG: PSD1 domain-containing protein [Undibacterium sp.]|nr:PSD1 domain-containing protein [Opitutaceae bacterium]